MLLTITCEMPAASDLGYLLHKNPANVYQAELSFGASSVFYPEVSDTRCTVALLLNVDPIGLVRNSKGAQSLDQYVNDRPYVASSFLSVALADAFGTAINGRSKDRPERVAEAVSIKVEIAALACAGGEELIARLFAPLGYEVTADRAPLDVRFPEWGDSDLYRVTLTGRKTVQQVLTHLYVLLPVLDNAKHYFVGAEEMEKLLRRGEGWLPEHPERDLIARRYLNYRQAIVRDALARLNELREDATETQDETDARQEAQEAVSEEPMRLNEARMLAALTHIQGLQPPAQRVLDLGCGEGRLLKLLLTDYSLTEIVGVDVAAHVLERASRRLHLDGLSERQRERIRLMQGSLVYRDERFAGFDVAFLVEVIEHLDAPRLAALELVVFHHARPRRVVVTTPNREYNAVWPSLPAGKFRHRDHRFEWTRAEFAAWSQRVAEREGYAVAFSGIGAEHEEFGSPTQMAVFDRKS